MNSLPSLRDFVRDAVSTVSLWLGVAVGITVWRAADRVTVHGLQVAFADPEAIGNREITQAWETKLDEALELLREYDSRTYSRLSGAVLRILVLPRQHPAYVHAVRSILLPSTFVTTSHPSQVAVILVHESTHAWLRAKGIHHPARMANRVERLCTRAELNFARSIGGIESAMYQQLQSRLATQTQSGDSVVR